jgi:hypothetical protein
VDTAPKASGCILGGTQGAQGGTGKAEGAKTAGRRNYPEAVPKERSGGNGRTRMESMRVDERSVEWPEIWGVTGDGESTAC